MRAAGLAPSPNAAVPVYCVTAHERRDMEVAEQVSDGRFTLAGVTRVLGTEPDWLGADLPPDEEWRIEWTKFYWGRDLAFAFAKTGEARFQRAWERLVDSWIAQVPPGSDSSDVAARRIQNWIYAWQDFAAAPAFEGLAAGLRERLAASIAEQAEYVRENLSPERNHRTLELYALFLVPLALPELDPDRELLAFALAELERALRAEFRSDGVHRESSTHYHLIALRSFLGARENARRFSLHFSREFDARLALACEFALHCTRPDGAIPALSDADTGRYGELLVLAGELLGRGDMVYAATQGRRGTPPGRRHVSFEAGGYHVQRSGWGGKSTPYEQERFLIFDCGPLGDGGHGHYDLLSVEIAGGGRPLVVDPGRYTYSEDEPPNLRRWFKGTAAHNTVTVDGLDQTPYRSTRPSGPVAEGRLLGRVTAPGLDVLAGEARSPAYEVVHTRVIAFVADRYWIVEDRLRGERPHRYDLRFHLGPEAQGDTCVDGSSARAPGLGLVFAGNGRPRLEPGWLAPVYGTRIEAPVLSVLAEGVEADFVTLVAPLGTDEPLPELTVRRQGERTQVQVDGGDPLAWRIADGRLQVEEAGVVMATTAVRPLLAPDPAVPARDLLLDPDAAAARLESCLGGEAVERCERLRVKYRAGESLRVLYAVTLRGEARPVSVRTFRGGRSAKAFWLALENGVPSGELPPALHDEKLDSVFWVFPNDRRIRGLPLFEQPQAIGDLLGRSCADVRLVAYVPETSATARCFDDQERTLAYAKVYSGDGAERALRLRESLPDSAGELRLPRVLAATPPTLLFEPLDGRSPLEPGAGRSPLRRLGAALADLHELPVPFSAPRFDRLDSVRLHTAAGLIALLRPEIAEPAERLAVELDSQRTAPLERAACLHGDPHPDNALVQPDAIGLVDLDDVCAGPPAADLARVLAVLAHLSALGDLPARNELELSGELLAGYASRRRVPDAETLRWHVAATLLVRHAAKSLSRFRPRAAERLDVLLARAEELIA